MRRILSLILALFLALMPTLSLACECGNTYVPSPVPSITIDDLYDVTGLAMIFRNPKFDHMAMVRAFSEDIVDCIPLILYPQENDSHIFFTLTYPIPTMEEHDCFIIDADGDLIGNADCHYLECLCGEWWYDVNLTLAPGKYQTDQVVYLVWVD